MKRTRQKNTCRIIVISITFLLCATTNSFATNEHQRQWDTHRRVASEALSILSSNFRAAYKSGNMRKALELGANSITAIENFEKHLNTGDYPPVIKQGLELITAQGAAVATVANNLDIFSIYDQYHPELSVQSEQVVKSRNSFLQRIKNGSIQLSTPSIRRHTSYTEEDHSRATYRELVDTSNSTDVAKELVENYRRYIKSALRTNASVDSSFNRRLAMVAHAVGLPINSLMYADLELHPTWHLWISGELSYTEYRKPIPVHNIANGDTMTIETSNVFPERSIVYFSDQHDEIIPLASIDTNRDIQTMITNEGIVKAVVDVMARDQLLGPNENNPLYNALLRSN